MFSHVACVSVSIVMPFEGITVVHLNTVDEASINLIKTMGQTEHMAHKTQANRKH